MQGYMQIDTERPSLTGDTRSYDTEYGAKLKMKRRMRGPNWRARMLVLQSERELERPTLKRLTGL